MNLRMVLKSLGILLICEAISMIAPLVVSIIYNEPSVWAFLYTFFILILFGFPLSMIKPANFIIYGRDGFAIVGLGWILVSFFGGLPFFISGAIPSVVDSVFESISGFTTTGASILTEIESLPKGILFWRSFTHWMGGMGVLMLALAVLPFAGAKTFYIMKAESPGPNPQKLVPKIGQTAKILYGIYILITVSEIILLLVAGMPLYDALVHTFGTAGTGGFSSRNASIAAYDSIGIEIIITIFMMVFGTNFALYYCILKGNFKSLLKNEELKFYVGIAVASMVFITLNLHGTIYKSISESLRYASFQVSSIITTTGYVSADFDKWPMFSKMILVTLMFVGGCAGSTGGGIKNIRILILLKTIRREIIKIIHPRAVHSVKIEGKAVDDDTLTGVLAFFFAYMLIFVIAVAIVSIDGKDFTTTVTSVAATIGNIGPGLGMVGATGNYYGMSVLSKLVLSLCMIVGRLEIFPMLILAFPSFWKKVYI